MQGVVMDIKDGRAVIFQKNGDITEIKDKGYQVGQQINISAYTYKNFMAMAACFLLVFIAGISGYTVYRTPASYVYVDINPSMRLEMNCFDRVISIVPLNDDAAGLIELYSFKTADMEQCIDQIVYACYEKTYLNNDNNDIELNVVTKNAKLNERIRTVSEKLKEDNWRVSVLNVDKEENDKALKYKTSPKRLKAVEDYTNVFGGTLEENFAALRGITNEEIYSELTEAGFQKGGSGSSGGKYKFSPERLKAVKEYTDTFGGNIEENMELLKGLSTEEIYAAIESETPVDGAKDTENSTTDMPSVQMQNYL